MTNAKQDVECLPRDRPVASDSTRPSRRVEQIDDRVRKAREIVDHQYLTDAIVSELMERFPDPRLSEIEISEQEARSIASCIIRRMSRQTSQ